jgi:hypothetical protein
MMEESFLQLSVLALLKGEWQISGAAKHTVICQDAANS